MKGRPFGPGMVSRLERRHGDHVASRTTSRAIPGRTSDVVLYSAMSFYVQCIVHLSKLRSIDSNKRLGTNLEKWNLVNKIYTAKMSILCKNSPFPRNCPLRTRLIGITTCAASHAKRNARVDPRAAWNVCGECIIGGYSGDNS